MGRRRGRRREGDSAEGISVVTARQGEESTDSSAPPPPIGQAQLEVLRYVQDHHPVTVRQVAEYLAAARGLTRTTALNVMERLREKGYLTRAPVGGVYHYSPNLSRSQLLRRLVGDFVQQALGGSLEPFVAYLADEVRLSDEERERLERRVRDLSRPAAETPDRGEEGTPQ